MFLDILCLDIYILRESCESFYSPASRTHTSLFPPAPALAHQVLSRAAPCCVGSHGSRGTPAGVQVSILQARFSAGLTHSTLKVYVVAIAAYYTPLGGQSTGRHPLVTHFLRGALRPPVRSRVPPWDLAVVLEALCKPPFEPLEEVSDPVLTLKPARIGHILPQSCPVEEVWPIVCVLWSFQKGSSCCQVEP